jgi:hypothetical protein
MKNNLLLYYAVGFLAVRYLIKKRKTAAGNSNTVTTIDLPPTTRTSL